LTGNVASVGEGFVEAGTARTWSDWRGALRVVADARHLRATVKIALVVGTVLFAINHLDVVLRGRASTATWVKAAITYLVPFVVSNLGVLAATRRRGESQESAAA
jgi:hypothetical protein